MNNAEAWLPYKEYTKDISEVARKLAFAGVALGWALKTPTTGFPSSVIVALTSLVLYFVLDLLQMYLGAVLNKLWVRRREKELFRETRSIEGEYLRPAYLDTGSAVLFHLKLAALLTAFISLGTALLTSHSAG